MVLLSLSLTLICSLAMQAAPLAPAPGPDCLLATEHNRLQTETNLNGRIKIYSEASTRCQNSLAALVRHQDLQEVPAQLKSWLNLLEISLEDINGSTARKDKSKALIRYEIHLRKAIGNVQEIKLKASADQFDDFERFLAKAQEIHKHFVNMLFQR